VLHPAYVQLILGPAVSPAIRSSQPAWFALLLASSLAAGPSCVRTLADWGADVIRVEPPLSDTEANELVGKRDGSDFQNLHHNKRAITLNLKTDEGREILMRLAEQADVIVDPVGSARNPSNGWLSGALSRSG
jgi:CoA-transferase family III